jgi:hypothetical protein
MALRRSALSRAIETVSPVSKPVVRSAPAVAKPVVRSAPAVAKPVVRSAPAVLGTRSTCVADESYDAERQVLTVAFVKGGTYEYSGVPETVAEGLRAASSQGHFMHAAILGAFPYQKV